MSACRRVHHSEVICDESAFPVTLGDLRQTICNSCHVECPCLSKKKKEKVFV